MQIQSSRSCPPPRGRRGLRLQPQTASHQVPRLGLILPSTVRLIGPRRKAGPFLISLVPKDSMGVAVPAPKKPRLLHRQNLLRRKSSPTTTITNFGHQVELHTGTAAPETKPPTSFPGSRHAWGWEACGAKAMKPGALHPPWSCPLADAGAAPHHGEFASLSLSRPTPPSPVHVCQQRPPNFSPWREAHPARP